jgi:hypothetical protein
MCTTKRLRLTGGRCLKPRLGNALTRLRPHGNRRRTWQNLTLTESRLRAGRTAAMSSPPKSGRTATGDTASRVRAPSCETSGATADAATRYRLCDARMLCFDARGAGKPMRGRCGQCRSQRGLLSPRGEVSNARALIILNRHRGGAGCNSSESVAP